MAAQPVTELLVRWRQGDSEALQALVPLVYNELHDIAHRFLRRERSDHTLRSTALVHEAYLRLVHHGPIDTQNRAHFVAIAARLMRQILVDYSRHHRAAKRGADCTVVLEEAFVLPKSRSADVIALDDALTGLARIDEQQSRIVELRFFGGLTTEETAQVLGISQATVKRDWSVAKAWLSRQMKRGSRGTS
jgi:RNA polymerase sigma-70 factor, ECF subfamily